MIADMNIENFLKDSIQNKIFTGASYSYLGKDNLSVINSIGTLAESTRLVSLDTLYDLASCTKIFVALAFMKLLEDGKIALTDTVERYLPSWRGCITGKITMYQLLTHTSMLPAHITLYRMCKNKEEAIEKIKYLKPRNSQGVEYSCIGFILLGWILEVITETTLDLVIEDNVCKPLNMKNTTFCPLKRDYSNIMPTEHCKWREKLLVGEVHDENAYFLGGISGNAGIFSTITDVTLLAEAMLSGRGKDGSTFLKDTTIHMMTKCYTKGLGENRGLGWRIKNTPDSVACEYFSDNSYGHTGYTGTSIWIDKAKNFYAILLTNRVYYTREVENINHVRQVFHNLTLLESLK